MSTKTTNDNIVRIKLTRPKQTPGVGFGGVHPTLTESCVIEHDTTLNANPYPNSEVVDSKTPLSDWSDDKPKKDGE